MADPLLPTPAYKLFAAFPYLAKNKALASSINVIEHVHFQKALQVIHDEDIIKLVHLYGLMPEHTPIVKSVGTFLQKRLQKDYPHLNTLIEYVNSIVNDDTWHYGIEPQAMQQLKEVQAATRKSVRFLRDVCNGHDFIDEEIEDFSQIFAGGPLWADFYPKMRENYMKMDKDWIYFNPLPNT